MTWHENEDELKLYLSFSLYIYLYDCINHHRLDTFSHAQHNTTQVATLKTTQIEEEEADADGTYVNVIKKKKKKPLFFCFSCLLKTK